MPTSINDLDGGIQINMRRMNDTKVNSGGKTATVGGGVMQHEIIASLSEYKKRAGTSIFMNSTISGKGMGIK